MVPLFTGVCDGIRHCSCLPWVSSAYCGWPPRGKNKVKVVGLCGGNGGQQEMRDSGVLTASRVG